MLDMEATIEAGVARHMLNLTNKTEHGAKAAILGEVKKEYSALFAVAAQTGKADVIRRALEYYFFHTWNDVFPALLYKMADQAALSMQTVQWRPGWNTIIHADGPEKRTVWLEQIKRVGTPAALKALNATLQARRPQIQSEVFNVSRPSLARKVERKCREGECDPMSQFRVQCAAIELWTSDVMTIVREELEESAREVLFPVAEDAAMGATGNITVRDDSKKKEAVAKEVRNKKDLAAELARKEAGEKETSFKKANELVEKSKSEQETKERTSKRERFEKAAANAEGEEKEQEAKLAKSRRIEEGRTKEQAGKEAENERANKQEEELAQKSEVAGKGAAREAKEKRGVQEKAEAKSKEEEQLSLIHI
eukprot:TRINITY_DN7917_c0_g1_i3.p1 TRINITY_DN7917_c0_g1~~TRINITY_DN7917_c0_g1_i3.p1  ORF type:complete len:367 (+),score=127.21 TRINITY_DN7917_c0_g1_i3:155-1255(+)